MKTDKMRHPTRWMKIVGAEVHPQLSHPSRWMKKWWMLILVSLCPGSGWRGEGDGWDHGEEEEEDKHELWDPHTQTHKITSTAATQS
jgi:hypothetical protein